MFFTGFHFLQQAREIDHGMGIPGLYVKIRVSVNVVIIKPSGYTGTVTVLFTPEPVGLVVFQGQ